MELISKTVEPLTFIMLALECLDFAIFVIKQDFSITCEKAFLRSERKVYSDIGESIIIFVGYGEN